MALRINHIQVLLMALNGPEFDYHSQSIMAEAVHALEAELHRLTHGPFTLAEAIASGRPFRQIGENPKYYHHAFPSEHRCNHCEIESSADKLLRLAYENPSEGHFASFYDIEDANWELMPEGGE